MTDSGTSRTSTASPQRMGQAFLFVHGNHTITMKITMKISIKITVKINTTITVIIMGNSMNGDNGKY